MLDASPRLRRVLLAGLLAISFALQLRLIDRGIPSAVNLDEPFFISPAIKMVLTRDANPHWLGHPASTLIYPLAAAFAVRGPSAVSAALADHPGQLVLTARALSMLAALLALVWVYSLSRRIFDDHTTGLVTVALLVPSQWLISLTTLARSDGVSLLFGALALDRLFAAHREPTLRNHLWAGFALGLAVATKYYFAVFGVVVALGLVGAFVGARGDRPPLRVLCGRALAAAAVSLLAFSVTTPYFLLDWKQAIRDLSAEGADLCCGITAPSAWQAFGWFLSSAFTMVWRWPMLAAIAVGVLLVIVRRKRLPLVALATAFTFLVSASLVRHRIERWLIPILPLLAAFAAHAVVTTGRALAERLRRGRLSGIAALLLTLVVAPSWRDTLNQRGGTGTFGAARSWIPLSLPSGSTIAFEDDGWTWIDRLKGNLFGSRLEIERGTWRGTIEEVLGQLSDGKRTLDMLRCRGFDYVVVNWWNATAYPAEIYSSIERQAKLAAAWRLRGGGTQLRLFDIRDLTCSQATP